jgi:hypothetical protein
MPTIAPQDDTLNVLVTGFGVSISSYCDDDNSHRLGRHSERSPSPNMKKIPHGWPSSFSTILSSTVMMPGHRAS